MRMKHIHLLPILSFVPILIALLLISQFGLYLDPLIIGAAAIAYLALNIIYRAMHETFEIGYVVEYSLIALIAYFILTQYV